MKMISKIGISLGFWETAHLPHLLRQHFALSEKLVLMWHWHEGGVGGQFLRNLN